MTSDGVRRVLRPLIEKTRGGRFRPSLARSTAHLEPLHIVSRIDGYVKGLCFEKPPRHTQRSRFSENVNQVRRLLKTN